MSLLSLPQQLKDERAEAMSEPACSTERNEETSARNGNGVDDKCGNLRSTSSPPDPSLASSLPVIDIGPLLSAPLFPQALEAAEAIAAACLKSRGERALGFFYAIGHGIPEETLDAAHAAAAALWDSPPEVRSSLDAKKSELARGYLGLGALEHTCTRAKLASLAQERLLGEGEGGGGGGDEKKAKEEKKEKGRTKTTKTSGDLKQSFAFGCEREAEDPRTHSPMHGPNQWPDLKAIEQVPALSGFRASAEEFRSRGLDAARAVARGLSLALTEEEATRDPSMFESALSKPAALTVMLRYPPLPEAEEGRGGEGGGEREKENGAATSCGAHTDCGFLTIIDQRGLPGLEVFSNQREWISVPPLGVRGQSALVVNLGDLAEYWSGGRVASTLHRVEVRKRKEEEKKKKGGEGNGIGWDGDGDGDKGPQVRDSIIVFSNANFDAPVVPTGGEGKPTTAGAYIFETLGIMGNGEDEGKKEKEKS